MMPRPAMPRTGGAVARPVGVRPATALPVRPASAPPQRPAIQTRPGNILARPVSQAPKAKAVTATRPVPPQGPPPSNLGVKRTINQVSGQVPTGPAQKAAAVGRGTPLARPVGTSPAAGLGQLGRGMQAQQAMMPKAKAPVSQLKPQASAPKPKQPAVAPPGAAQMGGAKGKSAIAKAPASSPLSNGKAASGKGLAAVGKGQPAVAAKGQPAVAGKGQPATAGKGQAQAGKAGVQTTSAASAQSANDVVQKSRLEAQVNLRMKNIEAHIKRVLLEVEALPEEKKADACPLIAERFVEQLSVKLLERLVAEFIAAGVNPNASTSDEAEPKAEAEAEAEEMEAEAEAVEAAEPPPAEEESAEDPTQAAEADDGNTAAMTEAMEAFLQACAETKLPSQWMQVWSEIEVPAEGQQTALAVLLEVAAAKQDTYKPELAPQIVVELVKTKKVAMKTLELALKDFAARLEELVEVNENAWHLESSFLLLLFPKTLHSSWGLLYPGWNWYTWWQMSEQILNSADRFRAFDILVLVLQMMQERSGAQINKQQVWVEAQRRQKVRKVLCTWGEMDEDSVVETLSAYGVEL